MPGGGARKHGNKRKSVSFQKYWAERRIIANKLRRWRKTNPKADQAAVRAFEKELQNRHKDTRK